MEKENGGVNPGRRISPVYSSLPQFTPRANEHASRFPGLDVQVGIDVCEVRASEIRLRYILAHPACLAASTTQQGASGSERELWKSALVNKREKKVCGSCVRPQDLYKKETAK